MGRNGGWGGVGVKEFLILVKIPKEWKKRSDISIVTILSLILNIRLIFESDPYVPSPLVILKIKKYWEMIKMRVPYRFLIFWHR